MRIRPSWIIVLAVLALATLACNLTRVAGVAAPTALPDLAATLTALAPSAAPTGQPSPSATIPPATATLAPSATSAPASGGQPAGVPVVQITSIATLGPRPQNTARPAPTSGGQAPATATRLSFETNATTASVSGSLAAGTLREYVLGAAQGQWMMVGLVSPDNRSVLSVYAPATGQVFLSKAAEATSWQGQLPATQDYVVRVTDKGGSSSYNLQITIPEVVSFSPGAVSAQRGGAIRAREVHTYLLRALRDQTMTVTITSPGEDVLLSIYGLQDGQPYKRYEVGDPHFTFDLPATQDYVIQAVSVRDSATTFTIDFRVE